MKPAPDSGAVSAWLAELAGSDSAPPKAPAGTTPASLIQAYLSLKVQGGGKILDDALAKAGSLLGMPVASPQASPPDDGGEYLSFLSHDMRGGLNGILLMIEVLKGDLSAHGEFAEQMGDLDMMRRSVLETVTLMDRFIFAERFRRGLVKIRRNRFDLRTLGDQLQAQFGAGGTLTMVRGSGRPPKTLVVEAEGVVEGDRMLIGLIVINLVSSAMNFGGGPEVKVELKGAGEVWSLAVSDGGTEVPMVLRDALKHPVEEGRAVAVGKPETPIILARLAASAIGAKFEHEVGPGGTRFLVQK